MAPIQIDNGPAEVNPTITPCCRESGMHRFRVLTQTCPLAENPNLPEPGHDEITFQGISEECSAAIKLVELHAVVRLSILVNTRLIVISTSFKKAENIQKS